MATREKVEAALGRELTAALTLGHDADAAVRRIAQGRAYADLIGCSGAKSTTGQSWTHLSGMLDDDGDEDDDQRVVAQLDDWLAKGCALETLEKAGTVGRLLERCLAILAFADDDGPQADSPHAAMWGSPEASAARSVREFLVQNAAVGVVAQNALLDAFARRLRSCSVATATTLLQSTLWPTAEALVAAARPECAERVHRCIHHVLCVALPDACTQTPSLMVQALPPALEIVAELLRLPCEETLLVAHALADPTASWVAAWGLREPLAMHLRKMAFDRDLCHHLQQSTVRALEHGPRALAAFCATALTEIAILAPAAAASLGPSLDSVLLQLDATVGTGNGACNAALIYSICAHCRYGPRPPPAVILERRLAAMDSRVSRDILESALGHASAPVLRFAASARSLLEKCFGTGRSRLPVLLVNALCAHALDEPDADSTVEWLLDRPEMDAALARDCGLFRRPQLFSAMVPLAPLLVAAVAESSTVAARFRALAKPELVALLLEHFWSASIVGAVEPDTATGAVHLTRLLTLVPRTTGLDADRVAKLDPRLRGPLCRLLHDLGLPVALDCAADLELSAATAVTPGISVREQTLFKLERLFQSEQVPGLVDAICGSQDDADWLVRLSELVETNLEPAAGGAIRACGHNVADLVAMLVVSSGGVFGLAPSQQVQFALLLAARPAHTLIAALNTLGVTGRSVLLVSACELDAPDNGLAGDADADVQEPARGPLCNTALDQATTALRFVALTKTFSSLSAALDLDGG